MGKKAQSRQENLRKWNGRGKEMEEGRQRSEKSSPGVDSVVTGIGRRWKRKTGSCISEVAKKEAERGRLGRKRKVKKGGGVGKAGKEIGLWERG